MNELIIMGKRYIFLNTLLISLIMIFVLYWGCFFLAPLVITYIFFYFVTYKKSGLILIFVLIGSFAFNYKIDEGINEEYVHTAVVDKTYSSSITVIEDGERYYLMSVDENLNKGDVISYKTYYNTDVDKGSFDMFYKSTKSKGYGYSTELEVEYRADTIRSGIKEDLYKSQSWYSDFSLLMLYGEETNRGSNVSNDINMMGISHLFVVSGFHMSLFFLSIEYIGSKLRMSRGNSFLMSFAVSTFFLYLVYFPPTGVRALLTVSIIRTRYVDKVDSLSIVGLFYFITNPWILFSSSMVLSFSITYAIYFYAPSKMSFFDMINLSVFAFYISLGTVSTWETSHNLLAPLLSIVMTPIVTFYYMLSLVLLPFSNLWMFFDPLFKAFAIIIWIFSHLHIIIHINLINQLQQMIVTVSSVSYIAVMRRNKVSILITFFSISGLLFLI